MTPNESPNETQSPAETQELAVREPSSSSQLVELKEKIYEKSPLGSPLRQGEIITNLIQLKAAVSSLSTEEPEIIPVVHPYAIVVTQDCELVQDFKPRSEGNLESDKIIPSVLFCQVVTAEQLRGRADIKSDIWKRIKQNKDERYQFLEKVLREDDTLNEGLPELSIDFKRYFTLPTDEVYFRLEVEAKRRSRLRSPYMEHLSSRFYYFQCRVALPADHRSE